MLGLRRNDYDVTNTVQVSSTAAVTRAVRELFVGVWPGESFDRVAIAFEEFDRLFAGRMPGYHGVDTVYHDRQHSLDMTLAMARLLVGYESSAEAHQRFGAERTPGSGKAREQRAARGNERRRGDIARKKGPRRMHHPRQYEVGRE